MNKIFALVLVLFLMACASPAPQTTTAVETTTMVADHVVSMNNLKFTPDTLTIKVGETVMWKNDEKASHTVAIDGVESQELFMGETWSHTFDAAGTFEYVCGIHASMKGAVIVE
ncbi:MAG: cupredoxin domain-containing protein [Nanoarchaeota archaeon]